MVSNAQTGAPPSGGQARAVHAIWPPAVHAHVLQSSGLGIGPGG